MKKLSFLFILFIAISCGEDDTFIAQKPVSATLVFPKNNQECNQGVPVPETSKTRVTFIWENDLYASSYSVVLKDLSTQLEKEFIANTNELTTHLEKATPYSWYVISYNALDLETVQSETWKFYNAGDAVTSYTPFPADAVFPEMAGTYIDLTSLRLQWNGLDIDNDITSYDVYFDTTKPLTTLLSNTIHNTIDVTVNAGNIYYWRVVTHDSSCNTSESEVFEFKIE